MTHIEQAFEDAYQCGFATRGTREKWNEEAMQAMCFLDPLFWQALGKARGWTVCESGSIWQGVPKWRYWWHRFIDHLADGKDAESFFKSLV
jgi:hypothetical protein